MSDPKRARVYEVVRRNIVQVLDGVALEAIRDDARLTDLGANSIDRADIVASSMQDLELAFPLRELADVKDIGGLVDALAARLP